MTSTTLVSKIEQFFWTSKLVCLECGFSDPDIHKDILNGFTQIDPEDYDYVKELQLKSEGYHQCYYIYIDSNSRIFILGLEMETDEYHLFLHI